MFDLQRRKGNERKISVFATAPNDESMGDLVWVGGPPTPGARKEI